MNNETLTVWINYFGIFLLEFLFTPGALACLNSPLTTRLVTSAGTWPTTSSSSPLRRMFFGRDLRTRLLHVHATSGRRSRRQQLSTEAEYRAINDDMDIRDTFRDRDDELAIVIQHHRGSSSSLSHGRRSGSVLAATTRTYTYSVSSFRYPASLCVCAISLTRAGIFYSLAVRRKRAQISDLVSLSRYEYRAVTIWLALSLSLFLSLASVSIRFSLLLSRTPAFGTKFVIRRTPRNAFENLALRRIPTVALKFRSWILSRVDCMTFS